MRLNAARDSIIDALAMSGGADVIREVAAQARTSEASRRADTDYAKCPRCWDFHTVWSNFGHLADEVAQNPELAREHLCDDCQTLILKDFPDHDSVPHIRSALAVQRKKFTFQS